MPPSLTALVCAYQLSQTWILPWCRYEKKRCAVYTCPKSYPRTADVFPMQEPINEITTNTNLYTRLPLLHITICIMYISICINTYIYVLYINIIYTIYILICWFILDLTNSVMKLKIFHSSTSNMHKWVSIQYSKHANTMN